MAFSAISLSNAKKWPIGPLYNNAIFSFWLPMGGTGAYPGFRPGGGGAATRDDLLQKWDAPRSCASRENPQFFIRLSCLNARQL